MYDAGDKRFVSEDPIKSGLNWYGYVAGNPLMWVDPLGLAVVIVRDYLEQRDASISWIDNETKNGVVYANAVVTYNGKTHNISSELKNGSMLLDDSDIDTTIGWISTVYYFYGSEQTDHATSNIKDLRNNDYAVISTLFTSTTDFTSGYNAMPESTDIVIINQHGNPTSITYIDLSTLDMTKNIGTFAILSCNAGHLWTDVDSIALQIADASSGNINQLIAADGTHFRGRTLNPFRGVEVKGNDRWKSYIDSSHANSASSQGFILYKWNGSSYDQTSIGKSFKSVKKLLNKVGV